MKLGLFNFVMSYDSVIKLSRCPMESCTLLVLGSQYGIQILDWNGAVMIHEMDFAQHGIGGDEKQVND